MQLADRLDELWGLSRDRYHSYLHFLSGKANTKLQETEAASSFYSPGACTFSPVDFGRNSVLQSLPVFDCPGQNSAWGQDELSS